MDDGERDRPPGDRDAGRRRTPPATHTPVDAAQMATSGRIGRIQFRPGELPTVDERLRYLRDLYADLIVGERDPQRQVELWFSFGKELCQCGDFETAAHVFLNICEHFIETLSSEQVSQAVERLIKSLFLMGKSIENKLLIEEMLRFIIEKLEPKFGNIFQAQFDMFEVAVAFRRGRERKESNVATNEAMKTGYEEAVELAKNYIDGHPEAPQMRIAELHRTAGAAAFSNIVEAFEKFIREGRFHRDPSVVSAKRKIIVDGLKPAEMHTRSAFIILNRNRELAMEDGELVRVAYNLARIITASASLDPARFSDARSMIDEFQRLALTSKNIIFIGWAKILMGELMRYAIVPPNLTEAVKFNQAALDIGKKETARHKKEEVVMTPQEKTELAIVRTVKVYALMNLTRLHLQLDETAVAQTTFIELAAEWFQITDQRLIDNTKEEMQELSDLTGLPYAIPKINEIHE